MLRNYIKTALRSLTRHRFFSLINITGLAIAMALAMAIIMLVADQMTYDRYNTKRDRIYRINHIPIGKDGQEFTETSTTSLPLKHELLENFSGIEKAVRLRRGFGNIWLELELAQDVNIPVSGYFTDPEILDIFEYELEYGDPKTALVEPYSVVLTRKTATKLFKEENPLGLTFKVGVEGPYVVTGVLKETENKTHIAFDALASLSTVNSLAAAKQRNKSLDGTAAERPLDNWYDANSGWVYVLLENGKTPKDIEPYLRQIEKDHFAVLTDPEKQRRMKYAMQPLMNITPGEVINNAIGPVLPWLFVYFFAGLAGVVMLTSCFNFTNLSIARSLTRAREIGVRKVTGAMRWQIFTQFLSESVIVSLFSLALAVLMLVFLKPLMLQLSFARMLRWDLEGNYFVYGIFLVFALIVGILAGFFPALVLSGFQPVKVLKNVSSMKLFSGIRLRKVLLTSQFAFSLIFILSVTVVFNQLQLYMRADHGFSMNSRMIVSLNNSNVQTLKNELLKHSNVENVAAASHIPAAGIQFANGFKRSADDKDWTSMNYYSVDENYMENIDIQLVAGEFFKAENNNHIIINESAVTSFLFDSPISAIGQELLMKEDSSTRVIVGVVKDYNHDMLMEKIDPMGLIYNPAEFRLLQVKYSGTYEEAGKSVTEAWSVVNPGLKVDYKDFNEEIHKLYDVLFGDLVSILGAISFLAIVISCLGLLGMATYSAETRIKEVSIRKILGSSNRSLVYLLSRGFVVMLATAICIAVPLAYLINNMWLEKLPYHVSMDLATIILGVVILIALGAITVGSQTVRAANVNPVDNLKSE